VDHTSRLIQHNRVVLAYNFNVVILVLIIGEPSISANSVYHFITVLSLLLPCIIILFLHLLSTNHKCTQPCYFPPATQTSYSEGEDGLEFYDESSRLRVAPDAVHVELWSLSLFHFVESRHSL
jgi:hypothetical protein